MKALLKTVLKFIHIKRLNEAARKLRVFYYFIFDLIGYIFFSPLLVISKFRKYEKEKIKKILIIRLDRIGDMVLSTPAIRAVRETFPGRKIHLLVSEYTKDLMADSPDIDKLLVYKKDKTGKDYDLAVALHPGFTQNYIAFISGSKFRAGYTGWGGGFFLTHRLKDNRAVRIKHEAESALEIAGAVGCETNNKKLEISVTEKGEKYADAFFKKNNLEKGKKIIAVHPGARQEYIRWKKEGFAEVSDRLIKEENAKIILIGGESEKNLLKEITLLMNEKPLVVVDLELSELVSLIKRCSLFIGNSTGTMHIASVFIPVVAIFGSQHPLDSYKKWGPWGEGHIIISKNLDCKDCHPSDCNTFNCMEMISVEEVYNAALKQLGVRI